MCREIEGDMTAPFSCSQSFPAIAAAPGSPIPAVVLSKMVLTVSTFTSAFFGAFALCLAAIDARLFAALNATLDR